VRFHLLIIEAALPACGSLADAAQTRAINIDQGTPRGGAHIHVCAIEAHGEGVRESNLIAGPDVSALSVVRDLHGNLVSGLGVVSRDKYFQRV
jgi:hypothetical protein